MASSASPASSKTHHPFNLLPAMAMAISNEPLKTK